MAVKKNSSLASQKIETQRRKRRGRHAKTTPRREKRQTFFPSQKGK